MSQQRSNHLRLAGLLAFVAVMPILAVPAVNQRLDTWLFRGEDPLGGPWLETAKSVGKSAAKAAKKLDSTREELASVKDSGSGAAPGETRGEELVERLPPSESAIDTNRFAALQKRLQELGAAYFRLEDTGSSQARYRFLCEVPLPGNSTYQRPFEQEDMDPIRAMERVAAEVEAWCAAQRTKKTATTALKKVPKIE